MTRFKHTLAAAATVWITLLGTAGLAHAEMNAALSDGEVRKVNKEAGKMTIKHGEIKSLDMPPMTMVFTVKDPALLDKVKAGDKVRFQVAREDGKMVVTEIEPSN